MSLHHLIESLQFWEVATAWGKELAEPEDLAARVLARGIVRNGLRFMNQDPNRLKPDRMDSIFSGYPYVGYCAVPGGSMVVLKASVLEHLLAVVERAAEPSREVLHDLFVSREDFRAWLLSTGQPLPAFWFGNER